MFLWGYPFWKLIATSIAMSCLVHYTEKDDSHALILNSRFFFAWDIWYMCSTTTAMLCIRWYMNVVSFQTVKPVLAWVSNFHKGSQCILNVNRIDPLGRPTITANSDHYFRTRCLSFRPSVFQNHAKQNNFQMRTVIATGGIVWSGQVDHWCQLSRNIFVLA